MSDSLVVNNRVITYEIIRKNIKNMYLRIKPDLTISITANPKVSKAKIEDFIKAKTDWIEKTIENLEKRDKVLYTEMEFKNGESYKLFGEQFIILIIPAKNNEIKLSNSNIYIYAKDINDKNNIARFFNKWYEKLIKDTLSKIVQELCPRFSNYHIEMPILKFRSMKTRWGTCSVNSKTITLNKALIHTPMVCIEYVVAHELAHFIHPNHSKQFYQVVGNVMPDYKDRKKLLENQIIL